MDSQKNILSAKKYSLISLILALTAPLFAIMLSVMMMTSYEPDVHYFKHGSVWFGVFVWAVIAVGVMSVILSVMKKKDTLPASYPVANRFNRPASIMAGVWLIASSVMTLADIVAKDVYSPEGVPVSGFSRLFAGRLNTVTAVAAIVGIIAALYFLLPAFSASCSSNLRVMLGCLLTLFFIFRLLVLYYDVTTPINSPVKMLEQMATVAAMLFIVYEMRFLLCDPRPRVYVTVSILAFILLAAHSTSQIIASCFIAGMPYSTANMISLFFELMLAVYIFAGLVSYLTACKFYAPEDPVEKTEE